MLIYNYKKEFLGIDKVDLETLGLSDLADLRAESADFADLFVKTPGFIHNFKHVHWIDYITCNDSGVESKAIINVKGENYITVIDIQPIYLVDNPSEKAFIINLHKVRPLSKEQVEKISSDILEKPVPKTATGSTELFTEPGSIVHDENSVSIEEDIEETSFDPYESSTAELSPNVVEDIYENTSLDVDTSKEGISEPENYIEIDVKNKATKKLEIQPEVQKKPDNKSAKIVEIDDSFNDYVFDPYIASEELGLPIDLVEEFIQDFIAQAKSFKSDLYKFVENADMNNLKIQSHKLKGVAANLRVEDALDTLTIINSSDNFDEIKNNLDRLYIIIEKLSDTSGIATVEHEDESNEEDEFILSIKDEDEENKEEELKEETQTLIQSDIPVPYNKHSVASEMGLNIDTFNDLFNEFINESSRLTKLFKDAYNNADLNECKNITSKLKSMSNSIRIHTFDSELGTIINSTNTDGFNEYINIIISKLKQISDTKE
jgi:hypothetical protein